MHVHMACECTRVHAYTHTLSLSPLVENLELMLWLHAKPLENGVYSTYYQQMAVRVDELFQYWSSQLEIHLRPYGVTGSACVNLFYEHYQTKKQRKKAISM